MGDTLIANKEAILETAFNIPIWYLIAKDLIMLVFALIGSYVALRGLSTWRKQLKGNTEYDLARRYLQAIYQVRDGIKELRSEVYYSEQIIAALRQKGIPENEILTKVNTVEGEAALYDMKMTKVNEALESLKLSATEAEVLWGKDANDVLIPLLKCIAIVWVKIRKYIRRKNSGTWESLPENEIEETINIITISDDSDSDDFSKKIIESVESAKKFILPHLKMR